MNRFKKVIECHQIYSAPLLSFPFKISKSKIIECDVAERRHHIMSRVANSQFVQYDAVETQPSLFLNHMQKEPEVYA